MAIGAHSALAGNGAYVAALDAERGLIGYVRPPRDTRWIGLGEGDTVLAADSTGALYVADAPGAAVDGEFIPRAHVKDASTWDAAFGTVAAVAGNAVYVSVDNGATFSISRPTAEPIVQVLVAPPQSVAVVAGGRLAGAKHATVWISTTGGRFWSRSAYSPARLSRMANWITDAMPREDVGSAVERCPAVLGPDGSWHMVTREGLSRRRKALAAWPSGMADSVAAYRSAVRPLLLSADWDVAAADVADRSCRKAISALSPVGGRQAPRGNAFNCASDACRGVRGVVFEDTGMDEVADTLFQLADDGVCSRSEGDACIGDLVRSPHVVVTDLARGDVDAWETPHGCAATSILTARGLGLLFCRRPQGTDVYVTSRDVEWKREMSIAQWPRHSQLRMGDDGTIVLTDGCSSAAACQALVRSPAPVGSPSAWRRAYHPNAVGYWPLLGGEVLAIDQRIHDSGRVELAAWKMTRSGTSSLLGRALVEDIGEPVRVRNGHVIVNGSDIAEMAMRQ